LILVCGAPEDLTVTLVRDRLEQTHRQYRLIDLAAYPYGYTVDWVWDSNGPVPHGSIAGPDWTIDIDEVSGVYVRYPAGNWSVRSSAVPSDLQDTLHQEAHFGLAALLEDLPCPVANRRQPGMANHSKPYQELEIRASGLQVPRSLTTTDGRAALEFFEACDRAVVIKSASGALTPVRRVSLADLEVFESGLTTPVYLQAYVPGDNVRVHTVAGRVFATRCISTAVDYRYSADEGTTTRLEPTEVPGWVAAACLRLGGGLLIAGIDLKQTPDGQYFCFEVNPAPVFAWYEQYTGQAIGLALVEALSNAAIE